MKMYFSKYKIGKPLSRFAKTGNHFTLDIGFFIATGNNRGIQFGFVTFYRNWYNVRFVYNRFKRRAV